MSPEQSRIRSCRRGPDGPSPSLPRRCCWRRMVLNIRLISSWLTFKPLERALRLRAYFAGAEIERSGLVVGCHHNQSLVGMSRDRNCRRRQWRRRNQPPRELQLQRRCHGHAVDVATLDWRRRSHCRRQRLRVRKSIPDSSGSAAK